MDATADGDQFEFEATNHGDVLLAGLCHLRDKQQLFDVVLIVENQELPAHRVVLASCSDYFRAMFTDGLKECKQEQIILNGVTAKGMMNLVDFAYTSKSNIDSENVVDVLGAANHVQILPVITACEEYLRNHMSLDNCVDIGNVAELYSLKPLEDFVHQFMCKHWTTFTMSEDFHHLQSSQLIKVLHSGFPVDCEEMEVLVSVVNWISYSVTERADMTLSLLDTVLFENINDECLEQFVTTTLFQDILHKVPNLRKVFSRYIDDTEKSCIEGLNENGIRIVVSPKKHVPGIRNLRGFHETLLVAGGFNNEYGMTNKVWYLDQNSSSLKYLTKIPHVDQCNFGMAVMHNQLYVVGGCFNDQMQEIIHPFGFRYDAHSGQWESIAPMAQERCRFVLAAVDGHLFAIGGDPHASDMSLDSAPCEKYDPVSNTWSQIESLPGNRTQHAGTSAGCCLYVTGGLQESDGDVLDDLVWYDTIRNVWESGTPMPNPRADHSMFVHEGKIYVMGGWFYDTNTHQRVMEISIDCYSIEDDSWESVGNLNESRLYATYTLFNSSVFVVGGWQNGNYRFKSKLIDIFNLTNQEWTTGKKQRLEVWEHSTSSIYLPKFI